MKQSVLTLFLFIQTVNWLLFFQAPQNKTPSSFQKMGPRETATWTSLSGFGVEALEKANIWDDKLKHIQQLKSILTIYLDPFQTYEA